MKRVLSIIISIIVIILVIKLFLYAVPVLVILGVGIWLYSKYKIKKAVKQYNEENNTRHQFTENVYKNDTKQEETNEFNGPIIDVDYEDIKND